ncbi:hypothetical protein H9P43_008224 [Blastocladiella emersonii ATCC 22665]|nr:hypothetical protein H9P43_008224 [Blastocladiella emersonii ATCC 22665]
MGKDRTAQRVKGNAQAASSASAQQAVGGFVGFSAFAHLGQRGSPSPDSSSSGSTAAADDSAGLDSLMAIAMDPATPSDLVVILRKLTKKEAVTKVKALSELKAYLTDATDCIAYLLPKWPRIFTRLGTDYERRVRILIFELHALLVAHAKKKLAPYLKELITTWVMARYDRDVAPLATASFDAVFPEAKHAEVFRFCRDAMIEELTQLTTVKRPDTLSDPRFHTQLEMETKYARVVACALQTVGLLAGHDKAMELLAAPELAAQLKSPFPLVRRAMVTLTRSLAALAVDPIPWRDALLDQLWAETQTAVATDLWEVTIQQLRGDAGFLAYARSAKVHPRLSKACLKYIAQTAPVVPAVFPALTVFLSLLPEISLDAVWKATKLAIRNGLGSGNNTAQAIQAHGPETWSFVRDVLLLTKNRGEGADARYIELVAGFVRRNDWSAGMHSDAQVLPILTLPTFAPYADAVAECLLQDLASLNVSRTIALVKGHSSAEELAPRVLSAALHQLLAAESPEARHHLLELTYSLSTSDGHCVASASTPYLSLDAIRAALPHCLSCAQWALACSDPADDHVVELLFSVDAETVSHDAPRPEGASYSIDSLLPFLPKRRSSALTAYALTHLDPAHLPMLRVALQGFVDRAAVFSEIVAENLTSLLTLLVDAGKLRDPVVAAWFLRHASDEEWGSVTVDADLVDQLASWTVRPDISTATWSTCFKRLGSPYTAIVHPLVVAVLVAAPVVSIRRGWADVPELNSKQPTAPAPEVLASVLDKLRVLSAGEVSGNPLSAEWLEVVCLVAALGDTRVAGFADEVDTASLDVLYKSYLASAESVTSTQLWALQFLSHLVQPDVATILGFVDAAATQHEQRILAALLSGVTIDSSLLEAKAEGWIQSLFETHDPIYLMLLNAAKLAPSPAIAPPERIAELVDELLSDFDQFEVQVHMAMLLLRHPCEQSGQFCWMFLDGIEPANPWALALLDVALELLDTVQIDPEEMGVLQQRVAELWLHPNVVCRRLSAVVAECPSELFEEGQLYAKLTSTARHVQVAAYHLLYRKVGLKVQELSLQLEVTNYDEIAKELQLHPLLQQNLATPHPIVHGHIELGWLLSWLLVFRHFESATLQLKMFWMDAVDIDALLSFIFRELADMHGIALDLWDVTAFEPRGLPDSDTTKQAAAATASAAAAAGASASDDDDMAIRLLCAHLYFQALVNTPSHVRVWWTESRDKHLCKAVEKLTIAHYSPMILQHELSSLDAKITDLTVRVLRSGTGGAQVSATYTIEDAEMELQVILPAQYPLRPVEVAGGDRAGVSESKWRGWLLSCKTILSVQNATILEALQIFLRNIQLHTKGATECAICYSIVGVSCKTLPNKPCRTCKHKFHGSCLYKWFKSSPQSTCPLCRSLF